METQQTPNSYDHDRDFILEKYKAELQIWVENHKSTLKTKLELTRATLSFGQNALKFLFLLNGAAAIAILTFLGNLAKNDQTDKLNIFSCSLAFFSYGVLLAVFASGFSYLSQWHYNFPEKEKAGNWYRVLTILFCLASCVLFMEGMLSTSSNLHKLI